MYNIKFERKIFNNTFYDFMTSKSTLLDLFIGDYYQAYLVEDFIISYINDVLVGVSREETIVSESVVFVEISKNVSKVYDDINTSSTNPGLIIPTLHFKELAEAWRDYLKRNNRP